MGSQKMIILGLLFILQVFCLSGLEIEMLDQWSVKEFWGKLEAKVTEQKV